jgi:hypothetical protein
MEVKTNEYHAWTEGTEIHLEGTMRLAGSEAYSPILTLMEDVLDKATTAITLNLTDLEFLNSSGINMIAKFTIDIRKKGGIHLTVKGSSQIPWQSKSLRNLQKLLPDLDLVVI